MSPLVRAGSWTINPLFFAYKACQFLVVGQFKFCEFPPGLFGLDQEHDVFDCPAAVRDASAMAGVRPLRLWWTRTKL